MEPGLASFPGSGWSYGRHAGCLVLLRRWTTPHSRARQHGSVADVPAWLVSWTNGVMRTPPGLTAGSRAPTPLQQPEAAVRSIDSTQCGLCGATLSARTLPTTCCPRTERTRGSRCASRAARSHSARGTGRSTEHPARPASSWAQASKKPGAVRLTGHRERVRRLALVRKPSARRQLGRPATRAQAAVSSCAPKSPATATRAPGSPSTHA